MNKERLQYLLEQWMERRATPEEERELIARLEQQGNDEVIPELLMQLIASATTDEVLPIEDRERRLSAILEIDKTNTIYKKTTPSHITFRRWGWVAASVLLLLAETAVVMLAVNANRRQPQTPQINVQDIAAGSSKAVLTLGSKTTVRLDSAGNQDLKRTSLEGPAR